MNNVIKRLFLTVYGSISSIFSSLGRKLTVILAVSRIFKRIGTFIMQWPHQTSASAITRIPDFSFKVSLPFSGTLNLLLTVFKSFLCLFIQLLLVYFDLSLF